MQIDYDDDDDDKNDDENHDDNDDDDDGGGFGFWDVGLWADKESWGH